MPKINWKEYNEKLVKRGEIQHRVYRGMEERTQRDERKEKKSSIRISLIHAVFSSNLLLLSS